ncbi:hypothetical protein, partial [Bacillus altitudinis]|uniref:hypothetical protein n=1 Tax=Bacillus altitudinis TaxID=293387 RepID=UPI001C92C898
PKAPSSQSIPLPTTLMPPLNNKYTPITSPHLTLKSNTTFPSSFNTHTQNPFSPPSAFHKIPKHILKTAHIKTQIPFT